MLNPRPWLIVILAISFFIANSIELEGDEMITQSWDWGQSAGITDGSNPGNHATRQEVMTMLHRFSELYTDSEAASETTPVIENKTERVLVSAEELDILYRIAWAEARGEDDKGLILVINVIMNRVNDPAFPNDIRGVVFAPNQFSPITNGAFDRAVPCQRIKDAVHRALNGEDYSQGATFFRSVRGAEGSWHERALHRIFTHGNHHFYEPRR